RRGHLTEGLRGVRGRWPARGPLRDAEGRDRKAQALARRLPVVPRSAQVRQRAARRLRTRRGADGGLDLRPAPRAGDHPVPADDGTAHALKLLAALFALMLAVGLVTLWLWRRSPEPEPCQSRTVDQSRSPADRSDAVLY